MYYYFEGVTSGF